MSRRDRHEDRDYREPESLTVAYQAIEEAERVANEGFRRAVALLNPPRDEAQDGATSARR